MMRALHTLHMAVTDTSPCPCRTECCPQPPPLPLHFHLLKTQILQPAGQFNQPRTSDNSVSSVPEPVCQGSQQRKSRNTFGRTSSPSLCGEEERKNPALPRKKKKKISASLWTTVERNQSKAKVSLRQSQSCCAPGQALQRRGTGAAREVTALPQGLLLLITALTAPAPADKPREHQARPGRAQPTVQVQSREGPAPVPSLELLGEPAQVPASIPPCRATLVLQEQDRTGGSWAEKGLLRGAPKSKLPSAAQQDMASSSWWPARCYKLSEELKGTNLACLVGDTGTCPSASSLSLKNISCSRFFWFSSSSRALGKENNTRAVSEVVLELWALSLQPGSQHTLLTARSPHLLAGSQLVSPLLHVLVVVLIQGLQLLRFMLDQEVTLLILKTQQPKNTTAMKQLELHIQWSNRICLGQRHSELGAPRPDRATKTSQGKSRGTSTPGSSLQPHLQRLRPAQAALETKP